MIYPYTGPRLIELLAAQQEALGQSQLFKQDTFTLIWRAKVGSSPHPDFETLVSAGEPCGAWTSQECLQNEQQNNQFKCRPEGKRNVGENWLYFPELPLNGYIPGSAIRGLVRSWVKKRPEIKPRMLKLLGFQDKETIQAGKIEFFDAWPIKPTKLTLDIVNPQQEFQVYHSGQGTPLSFYTLGNGEDEIRIKVAIRGIPGKATPAEVEEVWNWVQQALVLYGVGSRTASGYGTLKCSIKSASQPNDYAVKQFEFSLYSQGSAGPNTTTMEFRPSHWRGWLRSWILRVLLGVMSKTNAEITLGEMFGTLESPDDKQSRQGCISLQMFKGEMWGEISKNEPKFYAWEGRLLLSAPREILNDIILPIIQFAVSVGGVGRGWRRPLHIFNMNNGRAAARGTHLTLTHTVRNPKTKELKTKQYNLDLKPDVWTKNYEQWLNAVQNKWPDRVTSSNNNIVAEVFSPATCAVYILPGPDTEPLERERVRWQQTGDVEATRGDGMYLVYQEKPPRNYKRNPDVGGDAARGDPHCSWVSIRRVNIPHQQEETDCQEIVCLFMGGATPQSNHIRAKFLRDLGGMTKTGAIHLFGLQPPSS